MTNSARILIVEDSLDDAEAYGRLLATVPGRIYHCTVVADAGQALDLLATEAFDCAIIDYSLPGMDGLSLLRRIREALQFLPIVMLTGQARDDLAADVLESGANTYLDKASIDQAELHCAISAAIRSGAAARLVARPGARQVLIIDDNADDREWFVRILKSTSYASFGVVEAESGAAGLALLAAQDFEAIVLDHGLPDLDGLSVLGEIRRKNPFVPVLVITGIGNVTVAVKALQAGASDYLVKSTFDADRLGRSIADCVMKGAIAAKDAEILAKTEALRASEERNRLLLDSLSQDSVIMLDLQGNVASWNATAQRISGYAADEILGKNFAVFFTEEDIAAGVPSQILDIARGAGCHAVEGLRVRKDGSLFHAHVVIDAIRDETGALRGFANVIRDITELAAERAALRLANQRITLATEGGGIGIWDYAVTSGEMVWDAWMFRLYGMLPQPHPWRQDTWLARIHPHDLESVAKAWQDAIAGKTPYNIEFRVVWDDQSQHTLRGCAQLINDGASQGARLIGVNWDVTESRDLAAKLAQHAGRLAEALQAAEQANRAKSRFLAGMSHELRTPLNCILGNARLLRKAGRLQPAEEQRLDSMLTAGTHLLVMIERVLDLSAIETDRIAVQAERLDLRLLASACLDIVRPMAEEKGLSLHLSVAADVARNVVTDPVRLRQILLNLIGNAVKFTRSGGVDLRVRTTANGARMRFDVIDTGPGIPPDGQAVLFQEFGRLQTGEGRSVEGAGLGLALSTRLATLLGGQLGYVDNPGGGSIFWLEMPMLEAESPPEPAVLATAPKPSDTAPRAPAGPLHVLVVDDSEMNLDIAASFIHHLGHKVTCAGSGAEAVAAVQAGHFDLVFMDVQMPDMDGLEATRQIRALPGARGQVPIVALTAQVFTEQLAECRQAGMTGHLGKPFTEAALYSALADIVPGAPAERRLASPSGGEEPGGLAPVIDLDIYKTNTRLLRPDSVVSYLENIAASAASVLAALRRWDGTTEIGADVLRAAHKLAGNVGLFGFTRAADAARRFERAALTRTPDVSILAESLAAALQLSVREANARLVSVRGDASLPAAKCTSC
jgi:PAS domain S-box-containing protein